MKMLLPKNLLYPGFKYPKQFVRIVNQNLIDLDPWVILTELPLVEKLEGLKKRYPNRKLIPFARSWSNDDAACWDLDNDCKIQIIHDYADPGWENCKVYNTFEDWFISVINEMLEYDGYDIPDEYSDSN